MSAKVTLKPVIASIEFSRLIEKVNSTVSDTKAHAVTEHMFSKMPIEFNLVRFVWYKILWSASFGDRESQRAMKSDLTWGSEV